MSEKTVVNVPEWIKGTIFEQILDFHPNGEPIAPFVDIDEEIASNDKVIGEMSLYEKILHSILTIKIGEIKKMQEEDPNPDNTDLSREYDQKVVILDQEIKLFKDLMWQSIHSRFPVENSLGVRQGFKVVFREENEEDCENCPIQEFCPNAK